MDELKDFIDRELLPSLHNGNMGIAFPNIHFERRGKKWGANNYLNGLPHPNKRKWDKIFTSSDIPFLIKEQGGDSMNLIKFYQEITGIKNYREAVEALSSACGLTPPQREESESYRLFREKQEELEELCSLMKKELHNSETGKPVLDYLTEVRGYEKGFIDFADFGFCSPETASKLRAVLDRGNEKPTYLSPSVGETNILSLPYRTEGYIQGFVFRRIDGEDSGKYSDVFISQKAKKNYNLFGLTGISYSGKAEDRGDIIIVEGEIDALRAKYEGLMNIVASSGGEVSEEALIGAKRKGVQRVTILFDSEDTAEKQEQTAKKIEKAVSTIWKVGLEPFVASFEECEDKNNRIKIDVDSYLKNHTADELSHLIKYSSSTGAIWKYERILKEFQMIEQEGGEERTAEQDFSKFKRRVMELCLEIPDRTERDRVRSAFSDLTGGIITEESLREITEGKLQEKQKQQSIATAQQITQELTSLLSQGRLDEAIALGKKLTDLSELNREAQYSSALTPISLEQVKEKYKNKPSGIKTGYFFGEDGKQEELILQASALTYIGAPTSHGKTTFLQNLALRTAQSQDREGDVVFITFEETEEDIITEFLTLYVGEHLSGNLLRSIRTYYESGEDMFRGKGSPEAKLKTFLKREAEFNELLKSHSLRIYRRKNNISDLSGFIRYLNKTIRVKAVFVDYIQRIKDNKVRGEKKLVMEAVCDELMNVSIETGLPVILGAQVNREVLSPLEMENQHLADASDIEHSANTIVLLWNSDTKPRATTQLYYKDRKKGELSDEALKLQDRGFIIGQRGTLFAILSKNRGGQRNLTAVFSFEGNTRRIEQLSPSLPDSKNKSSESSSPMEQNPQGALFQAVGGMDFE